MDMVGAKVAASREKTWDEKTDAERIELLRRELRASNALLAAIHKEFRKLARHTHTADGIAIPYDATSAGDGGGPVGYRYDSLA